MCMHCVRIYSNVLHATIDGWAYLLTVHVGTETASFFSQSIQVYNHDKTITISSSSSCALHPIDSITVPNDIGRERETETLIVRTQRKKELSFFAQGCHYFPVVVLSNPSPPPPPPPPPPSPPPSREQNNCLSVEGSGVPASVDNHRWKSLWKLLWKFFVFVYFSFFFFAFRGQKNTSRSPPHKVQAKKSHPSIDDIQCWKKKPPVDV